MKNENEAQDEGAAGEPVAWRWRFVLTDGPVSWRLSEEPVKDHPGPHPNFQRREVQPLYAHPSPTAAADADRVRIAVEALEEAREDLIAFARGSEYEGTRADATYGVDKALAALKSTAAKEGENS